MTAYYNEFDPYAAAWLRNLIAEGHIAPGDVDERSIVDVRPDDLKGYTQVHFFAGIGGWSLAARIAGWPDDKPLWTGSCPCQPYSAAGKRKGAEDARNLWPEMRRLVSACRPAVVAGEQVASKDGRIWLAGVRTDLEDVAYDVWAADTCAAGAGAPHIRQRLYWLADAPGERRVGERLLLRPEAAGWDAANLPEAAGSGAARELGDASRARSGRDARAVPGTQGEGERQRLDLGCVADEPVYASATRGLGDADVEGCARQSLGLLGAGDQGYWSRYDVVHCTDGKARRFEPGSFPLAHGVSSRVGRLRAYGNAIVPEVAAQVLGAYLDGRSLCLTEVSDVSDDKGVFA